MLGKPSLQKIEFSMNSGFQRIDVLSGTCTTAEGRCHVLRWQNESVQKATRSEQVVSRKSLSNIFVGVPQGLFPLLPSETAFMGNKA